MAITTKTVCDVCGKEKGEVNHWLKAFISAGNKDFNPDFRICWADDPVIAAVPMKDLCGQECAVKALSEWMASQSEQSK